MPKINGLVAVVVSPILLIAPLNSVLYSPRQNATIEHLYTILFIINR